jgi:hypothetical protein
MLSAIDIELGYHSLFRKLSSGPQTESQLRPDSDSDPVTGSKNENKKLAGEPRGGGGSVSFTTAAITHLEQTSRIEQVVDGDTEKYRLLSPEEYREEVSEPQMEPIRTVYEKGSVSGCHDNAVFAMVAFYEMVGMSWEETREHVLRWIDETGTWERGGFVESDPEQLVDQKRHVYESGYGWKEKAKAAKKVIDQQL